MMKIVVEIDEKKCRDEFNGAHSNAVKRRLLEIELTRQLVHQAVKRALREFHKWYDGEKTFLNEPKKK